jgi:hypothetical protein
VQTEAYFVRTLAMVVGAAKVETEEEAVVVAVGRATAFSMRGIRSLRSGVREQSLCLEMVEKVGPGATGVEQLSKQKVAPREPQEM